METEKINRLSLTRREMLEVCGITGGLTLMIGSTIYSIFTKPSEPSNLARYIEIDGELKKSQNVSLEDLESESPELIARANELRDERDKIISDPDFAELRKTYESKRDTVFGIFDYLFFGGAAILSSSLGSMYLKTVRKRIQSSNRSRTF